MRKVGTYSSWPGFVWAEVQEQQSRACGPPSPHVDFGMEQVRVMGSVEEWQGHGLWIQGTFGALSRASLQSSMLQTGGQLRQRKLGSPAWLGKEMTNAWLFSVGFGILWCGGTPGIPSFFRGPWWFEGTSALHFPSDSVVNNLPVNAGDTSSIPGLRRIPWRRKCNPHQYSCLENPMDRGAWKVIVHGIAKESDTT